MMKYIYIYDYYIYDIVIIIINIQKQAGLTASDDNRIKQSTANEKLMQFQQIDKQKQEKTGMTKIFT